jgi:hypothetical protein
VAVNEFDCEPATAALKQRFVYGVGESV